MEIGKGLLMAFIGLMISIAFIGLIADSIFENRTTDITRNATSLVNIDDAVNTTQFFTKDFFITSIIQCHNETGAVAAGMFIPATNYTLDKDGKTLHILKSDIEKNVWDGEKWNCTFVYEPELYVKSSIARTLLGLIGLLVVIGVVLWLLSLTFPDWMQGIFDK